MTAKISIVLLSLFSASLSAQSATKATSVHTRPEVTSPILQLIKSGDPLPAIAPSASAPAGWTAVVLPGPHEAYVNNSNIDKSLDVKAGAPLHADPKSDAAVLTTFQAGDDVEITGLRGRWTQIRLKRDVIAYIEGSAHTPAAPKASTVATATISDVPARNSGPQAVPSPAPTTGRQINRSDAERNSLAALPRLFEGKLASTRVPLRPRRPYDFALEAEDGTRFAYLDLTKLLLTEQIENYLERTVVVYGVARPVPDTKDIVISVESLQLR